MNYTMVEKMAAPGVDTIGWFAVLEAAADRFQILGQKEGAGFLANAAHECAGFTVFSENLNYSWTALLAQWANRFTPEMAIKHGRVDNIQYDEGGAGVVYKGKFYRTEKHRANPEAIANVAYGKRYGNIAPGDGWKFRGRGIFQLTFFANYKGYADSIGDQSVLERPEQVAEMYHAANSAAWFWKTNNCSYILLNEGFVATVARINGGDHGLKDRTARYNELLAIT